MFLGLNKKILYSLLVFFLLIIGIFFVIFINFYAQRLQDNQNSIYIRNQYVVSLLYDNIRLQKTLIGLSDKYPELEQLNTPQKQSVDIHSAEKELTREQQLNAELLRNYDKNKEAITTGFKLIGVSLLVVTLLILLLMFLLDYWVIHPIEKMTSISENVTRGVFSSRIEKTKAGFWHDEFDILYNTFNQMLDRMEEDIESARMRENFLQQLVDAVPDAIRVLDKDYNVVMENNAFKQVMQNKEVNVGCKCYKAYGYQDDVCSRSRYQCPILYLQNQKMKSFHAIHEVNNIPLYVSAARLFINKNRDDYYIIEAMHDLRPDVMFSHQQKISSLAFLSTSIAHEMKNNLGAIRMILESILSEDKKNEVSIEERKKYLTMAYNQLVETIKVPERLLKMAQYTETEVTEIDIKNAISDVTQMIDYSAKRDGIETEYVLENNLKLSGNESDFKMILLNLLQNAVKAMPDGGKLSITSYQDNKKMFIKITDTGIGIEEEKIKHIFEPFYSGNEKARSSGLGLAIVNTLVNKMKGQINVSSEVGKGTTFILQFPLATLKSK